MFLKKLRENGFINLENIEQAQIIKFNQADYANINELMSNTKQFNENQNDKINEDENSNNSNKIDYASKFT